MTVDERHDNHDSITVVLTLYKRPEALKKQLESIASQTLKPEEILLFHDRVKDGEDILLDPELRPLFDGIKEADENIGVWGRFRYAKDNAKGRYICVLDDDTIPGCRWLETCMQLMKQRRAIYAALGICLIKPSGYPYSGYYRVGWNSANKKCEEVDFAGHAWFFEKECLNWMFEGTEAYQAIKTAAEDMNISVRAKEHGVPTVITPHPVGQQDRWGSIPKYAVSYGNDMAATGINGNYENMNRAIRMLEMEGWTPLYKTSRLKVIVRLVKQKLYIKYLKIIGKS